MHDPLRQFDGPRTLDDLLEETERFAAEGASEGRRIFNAADLDAFARAAGAVEVIDGTTGPRFPVEREARPVRTLTLRDFATAVDVDGDSSPEAIMLREDARYTDDGGQERPDWWDADDQSADAVARRVEWYRENGMRGVEEAARGARRVPGTTGGGDRGRKKSRSGGRGDTVGPTKMAAEHWDHERGAARSGKQRPAFVGGRVTHETKATLDADKTASNGEVLDEVGVLIARTGWTKARVVEALQKMADTGMLDPDLAEAMPGTAQGEVA